MEKLGIYTQTATSTSTSAFDIELEIYPPDTGLLTAGELFITGLSIAYDSAHRYYKFIGVGDSTGSNFSAGDCLIYNRTDGLTPTITLSWDPITGGGDSYILKVTITPSNSTNTKWNVHYKDLSYEIS
jgi:hypothetical protein